MERSIKVILIIIVCLIGFSVLATVWGYVDNKYFEGFWHYLAGKPKHQQIDPRYYKYVPIRDKMVTAIFAFGILVGIGSSIYWKIRIKRGR